MNRPNVLLALLTFAGCLALVPAPTHAETTMKLWKEIDIARWAGSFPCLGDLNNDGRMDVLLYRQGPQTTPGFMVAVDHDGQPLWQRGDPTLDRHQPDGVYNEPALRGNWRDTPTSPAW